MQTILSRSLLLICIFLLVSCSSAPAGTSSLPTATQPAAPSTPAAMPCTVFHVPVTPEALGADPAGRGHIRGPADAPVSIIVFSDYQCPLCAYLAASVKQIQADHPEDVQLAYLNTWLPDRDKDALAFQAAEAAGLQGKFWEMHDLLFEKLADWMDLAPGAFEPWVVQQSAGLGLDAARFQSDFEGETVAQLLQQSALSVQNSSAKPPTIFINGKTPYLADYASLETTVSLEALAAHQFSACPPWGINPARQYLATLQTARGEVVIQLFAEMAPLAVNNFVFLSRQGWYDGIPFYRVTPGLLVESGDPSGTGMGNPGFLFDTELPAGLNFAQAGMVALQNDGPGTNGSRFFITLAAAPSLDGRDTIIGQVLSGLDVLKAMAARDPQRGSVLPPGDELIRVTIEER